MNEFPKGELVRTKNPLDYRVFEVEKSDGEMVRCLLVESGDWAWEPFDIPAEKLERAPDSVIDRKVYRDARMRGTVRAVCNDLDGLEIPC
jgi:hypothetical protein